MPKAAAVVVPRSFFLGQVVAAYLLFIVFTFVKSRDNDNKLVAIAYLTPGHHHKPSQQLEYATHTHVHTLTHAHTRTQITLSNERVSTQTSTTITRRHRCCHSIVVVISTAISHVVQNTTSHRFYTSEAANGI